MHWTELLKLKSISSNCTRAAITLCLLLLASACGNNNSGSVDGGTTTIVVDSSNASFSSDSQNDTLQANDTASVTADSVQNDPAPEQQPNVIPNVFGGLPDDCLIDVSANNVTFCYQANTRTLRAWQSGGAQWWGVVLPGDNATNKIHALQVVNGNLYIVAELKTNGEQTGFEVSSFAFGGAFIKTVTLNKFQDYSFIAGQRVQVDDIDDNLIIVGDYGLSSNNIVPNQYNGTFLAVFNTTSDEIVNSILYPQLRQTNPMLVSNNIIKLELEHLVYDVSLDNLRLANPVAWFQSISFNRSNYLQKSQGLIGLIEKPPIEELHTRMHNVFLKAVEDKRQLDPDISLDEPVECTGGGTVQQSTVVDDFGYETRTTTFDQCSTDELNADGVLLLGQSRTCVPNCESLNKTLRALAFTVSYINGENWAVDGYISINESQDTLNELSEQIDDPETVYTNLTEINEFSISNDQITIALGPGQYRYDGTLENGTGIWIGSGSINYTGGVAENFSIDLLRQLRNGSQINFNGQMKASRSDGTSLFVEADSTDVAGVQYTITSANGESVAITDGW